MRNYKNNFSANNIYCQNFCEYIMTTKEPDHRQKDQNTKRYNWIHWINYHYLSSFGISVDFIFSYIRVESNDVLNFSSKEWTVSILSFMSIVIVPGVSVIELAYIVVVKSVDNSDFVSPIIGVILY